MFKRLRAPAGIALGCVTVCALIIVGDCYLTAMPHIHPAWQSLASIATLAVFLPTLVIGIQMTAISVGIILAYRDASRSDKLLLRAGLDPTDFQTPSSVRPPHFPK